MIVSPARFGPTVVGFVNAAAYAFVISSLSGAPLPFQAHEVVSWPSFEPPPVKNVPSPFGFSTVFGGVPAGTHAFAGTCVTHCGTNTRAAAPDCASGGIAPRPPAD